MDGLADQNLEYMKIEEFFEDRNFDIFDTILPNRPIETIKNKMKLLRDQGTDMHGVYSRDDFKEPFLFKSV